MVRSDLAVVRQCLVPGCQQQSRVLVKDCFLRIGGNVSSGAVTVAGPEPTCSAPRHTHSLDHWTKGQFSFRTNRGNLVAAALAPRKAKGKQLTKTTATGCPLARREQGNGRSNAPQPALRFMRTRPNSGNASAERNALGFSGRPEYLGPSAGQFEVTYSFAAPTACIQLRLPVPGGSRDADSTGDWKPSV
jgi:hypothetical protein